MGDLTKSFLYAWCGQNKVVPSYDVRSAGNKMRQRFICEVAVPGHNYVGVGNSTSKKDAQTNAARDFLLYLVRGGHIKESEVPIELPTAVTENVTPANLPEGGPPAPHIQLSRSGNQSYPIRNNYAPFNQDLAPDLISRVVEQMKMEETAVTENVTPANLPEGGPPAPHIQLSRSGNQSYPIRNNYAPFNQDLAPDLISRVVEQMKMEETAVTENVTPANLPEGGPPAPHIPLSSSGNQSYPIRNNYAPFNQDLAPDLISRVVEQRIMEEDYDFTSPSPKEQFATFH